MFTLKEVVIPIRDHVAQRQYREFVVGTFVKAWGITNGTSWFCWCYTNRKTAEFVLGQMQRNRLTESYPIFVSNRAILEVQE